MNPYVLGAGVLALAIMGWLLKGAYERNGELEAKLQTQADETIEAADANDKCTATVTELETKIATMVEERRVDTERREQVLVEREQELLRAQARADELERERDREKETSQDCKDLTGLSVDFFCPTTAEQLRQRSRGPGSDRDTDGGGAG